jgi:hypothetical protein
MRLEQLEYARSHVCQLPDLHPKWGMAKRGTGGTIKLGSRWRCGVCHQLYQTRESGSEMMVNGKLERLLVWGAITSEPR